MLLYLLLASLRGALPVTGAAPRKSGEETPGQLRSKADEALLKKDTDTALSLLARAIKLEPDNEYLLVSAAPAWGLLRQTDEIDLATANAALRAACGLPAATEDDGRL